jgi:hypothetical protein
MSIDELLLGAECTTCDLWKVISLLLLSNMFQMRFLLRVEDAASQNLDDSLLNIPFESPV